MVGLKKYPSADANADAAVATVELANLLAGSLSGKENRMAVEAAELSELAQIRDCPECWYQLRAYCGDIGFCF